MNSFGIPVTAFRQILILPLTLAPDAAEDISKTIRDVADGIGNDGTQRWVEIQDHLGYLGDTSDKSAYAEFVYFHAYIQKFLYDWNDPNKAPQKRPLRLFSRNPPGEFVIGLNIAGEVLGRDEKSVHVRVLLPIERIHLYLFELGVAILAVEVAVGKSPATNGPMAAENGKDVPLSLAHAQALQNALRRLYPPYFLQETVKDDDASKIPEYPARRTWSGKRDAEAWKPSEWIDHVKQRRHNPIDPVWRAILAPLAVEGSPESDQAKTTWRQIIDERIPSMLFLGVRDQDAPGVEDYDFARLCFCDGPGGDWAYAKKFMRGYERKHFYDRFWYGKSGTRYMFSGYSMVAFGTGDPDKPDDTFHSVLKEHFRRHYFQMGLLIQLQFAALLSLSHRVSDAVTIKEAGRIKEKDGQDAFRDEMKAIEDEFLDFEQRYWFSQVSNQLQAREIYDLWMEKTGVNKIYEEVRGQVRAANAYLDARAQEAQTGAATHLSVVAAFGVFVGVALAFLGMNVLTTADFLAAFGVPKDVVSAATPMKWPGKLEMLMAHASVFFAALTLSFTLGRGLLLRYSNDREPAGTTKQLNGDLYKAAIASLVLFLVSVGLWLLYMTLGQP